MIQITMGKVVNGWLHIRAVSFVIIYIDLMRNHPFLTFCRFTPVFSSLTNGYTFFDLVGVMNNTDLGLHYLLCSAFLFKYFGYIHRSN